MLLEPNKVLCKCFENLNGLNTHAMNKYPLIFQFYIENENSFSRTFSERSQTTLKGLEIFTLQARRFAAISVIVIKTISLFYGITIPNIVSESNGFTV